MAAPGVRVQVDGSISEPAFDGQHLGEVSGETSLRAPISKAQQASTISASLAVPAV